MNNPYFSGPEQTPKLKKSLGQNFLKDQGTARRIVETLDISAQDYVLEIGPGAGALTVLIREGAQKPCGLLLLEKDRHWVSVQSGACAESGLNCLAVNGDALNFAWERLDAGHEQGQVWKIISNLPYNVASPLIWDMVSRSRRFSAAVLMVQKEVAQRITAAPGSKTYGALSVWVQSFVEARKVIDVSPSVFFPPPKVWSQVLKLTPLSHGFTGNMASLEKLLKICFQKRRKQLGTILRPYLSESVANWFESQDLSLTLRPEELNPTQFQSLSSTLFQ